MVEQPNLIKSMQIPPMKMQKYERYLPSAFDESLSILEKINKVIYYLWEYSDITNEMINKWNEVIDWVTNEGLEDIVNARLNEWLQDGTFDDILASLTLDLDNYATKNLLQSELVVLKDSMIVLLDNYATKDLLQSELTVLKDSMIVLIDALEIEINNSNQPFNIDGLGVVLDAVGDGVTDNTQSLKDAINELKRIGGTRLFINAGDYLVSETILFDLSGIDILGVPQKSIFRPTDNFIGDDLFLFSNGFDTAISGLNIEGIKIDMSGKFGNGLTVVNGYQFIAMKNVSVIEVSPSSTALNFAYSTTHGIAGQTLLLENVYGIKSGAGNTSPTLFMERYQEVVFNGVKMFGSKFDSGSSSDGYSVSFQRL